MERVETQVVVIGAGPAGLAVGACLQRAGVSFELLERNDEVASTWRSHYERLHLHTMKEHSSLPFRDFPADAPRYVPRHDFVAYLDQYAREFSLSPRFATDVSRVSRAKESWEVFSNNGKFCAKHLVVATGYNRVPNIPDFPGMDSFQGTVIHSSAYKSGASFSGQNVLVIGCGNSGAEIALDLWEHGASPTLVVRSPIHVIPRELLGMPSQKTSLRMSRLPVSVADRISRTLLGIAVGNLSRYGIKRPTVGPIRDIIENGRVPLIDVGTISLIKQGKVQVTPGVASFGESKVQFVDGQDIDFDAVVLATGYRAGLSEFLEGAQDLVDSRGYPKWHGVEAPVGQLYFIGYGNPPTGALREIKIESQRIAGSILEHEGADEA